MTVRPTVSLVGSEAASATDAAAGSAAGSSTASVAVQDLLSARYSRFAERAYQARADVGPFVAAHRAARLTRTVIEARLETRLAECAAGPLARADDDGYAALCAALRLLRTDIFCLVMERDLAGTADVAEVTRAMSDLAEVTTGQALRLIETSMTATFGAPLAASSGEPLTLGVVGMGKLGGCELNVSSDIDLIFVYEEDGQTAGGTRQPIPNHDFFTRVGRKLIGALAERTAEGYVFRVDMRLRPNGDSGPLVCSLAMLEEYFYVQGREWERYAWIKGRLLPLAGPANATSLQRLERQLDALVRPFIYRRYLDFGVIDAIRSLHEQIGQEARRRASLRPELSDDIKLGRGGIREIEFSAQVFQLIRGGQDAGLRVRPTLDVLARATARGLIGTDNVAALRDAYWFLRRLEHRLQYADDAQTHAMPVDPALRERLCASMGFDSYDALHDALDDHRARVEREFDHLFDKPEAFDAHGERVAVNGARASLDPAITTIWSDALFDSASQAETDADAAGLGFPPETISRLRATRTSLRYVQMPPQSRERFDALVWRAIDTAREQIGPDSQRAASLSRLMDFLERISGRSAYLALLTEYPAALHRVFDVLSSSQWAASYLISHPQLLDELLDGDAIDTPFDWPAFQDGLRARLAESDGVEQQMDQLRHAQHAEVFRILLRDLAGRVSVEQIGDRLSELADAVLNVTLETVWRSIRDRPALAGDLPRFAIIAYGKLGGKELGYASDLDLIFLYDDKAAGGESREGAADDAADDTADDTDAAEVYSRLARRLVTWMTTATGAGLLYDIDLRLRPNGSSGLLVTSLEAFRAYQSGGSGRANTAWVWEHQAITRARFCAGDARVGAAFEAIRADVVATPRDAATLAGEIVSMREKARDGHPNRTALFDLKHDRGGMVDIEFIVQYLVLLHASEHPELIRNTGNIGLLIAFAGLGILSDEEARVAGGAYRRYRALQHRLRLDGAADARVPPEGVEHERRAVEALWARVFSS